MTTGRHLAHVLIAAVVVLGTCVTGTAAPVHRTGDTTLARGSAPHCFPGARTLGRPGTRMYPETGNGGYVSTHTLVRMVYNARTNRFLTGNHVVLDQRATQCLSEFSLDFERRSADRRLGPDLRVRAITVDGHRARFRFVRPTYPGDPHGPDDPDPRAHQASQGNPVNGPHRNPLPPACSPRLRSDDTDDRHSMNGTMCPATKLVVTPRRPIAAGATFSVRIDYTGRPGRHNSPDGSTEGWQRSPDGGYVSTEPIGTQAWMPLNNHPTAKPTYDFRDTVTKGRTVLANGILRSVQHHRPTTKFPHGSTTWRWHSSAPIANYLVINTVGRFRLSTHVADNGVRYYQAQDTAIGAKRQRRNTRIMNQHQAITEYESQFNGPYPFSSNGVLVGLPDVDDEMEMQTMITFDNRRIDLSTFWHENMHQWWGDNVGESSYEMTYFKEGLAVLSEIFLTARRVQARHGGPHSRRGHAAFERSVRHQFAKRYAHRKKFWTIAPSRPHPWSLFSDSATYERPAAAYVALRAILGADRFSRALQQIQRDYGGGTITQPQERAVFARWLPNRSSSCQRRLDVFFRQWFDTRYPRGGRSHRPSITGPGLAGPDFYRSGRNCG